MDTSCRLLARYKEFAKRLCALEVCNGGWDKAHSRKCKGPACLIAVDTADVAFGQGAFVVLAFQFAVDRFAHP